VPDVFGVCCNNGTTGGSGVPPEIAVEVGKFFSARNFRDADAGIIIRASMKIVVCQMWLVTVALFWQPPGLLRLAL